MKSSSIPATSLQRNRQASAGMGIGRPHGWVRCSCALTSISNTTHTTTTMMSELSEALIGKRCMHTLHWTPSSSDQYPCKGTLLASLSLFSRLHLATNIYLTCCSNVIHGNCVSMFFLSLKMVVRKHQVITALQFPFHLLSHTPYVTEIAQASCHGMATRKRWSFAT